MEFHEFLLNAYRRSENLLKCSGKLLRESFVFFRHDEIQEVHTYAVIY